MRILIEISNGVITDTSIDLQTSALQVIVCDHDMAVSGGGFDGVLSPVTPLSAADFDAVVARLKNRYGEPPSDLVPQFSSPNQTHCAQHRGTRLRQDASGIFCSECAKYRPQLPTPWGAASGSGKKRTWWVGRYLEGPHFGGEAAEDRAGRMRTFSTREKAEAFASSLNGPRYQSVSK